MVYFEPDYTIRGRHYAHPLVQWSSVAAGAVLAIALGAMLSLVGLAIGAGFFNPYHFERQDAALSVGGGLYMIFANFVAFEIAGYVATRSSRFPDHFGGALTGILVWALAVAAGVFLAAFGIAGMSASDVVTSGAADTAQNVQAGAEPANTGVAADALSTLAWWAAAALLVGGAGAVAGGWIGAHHPKWEHRPRLEDSVAMTQR